MSDDDQSAPCQGERSARVNTGSLPKRLKPMIGSVDYAPAAQSRALRMTSKRRAQVTRLLPEIIERTRGALAQTHIGFDVFFLIPRSGDTILQFGTTAELDPSDEEWNIVSDIVCKIVKDVLMMKKVITRELVSSIVWPVPPRSTTDAAGTVVQESSNQIQ